MTSPFDVCVVASFMTDLVVRAPRRPAAGETIIGTSFERFLGGKGFNQAVAAARAGARTAVIGRLGDDPEGEAFRIALERDGIDQARVITDPRDGTGVAVPLVEEGGENSIVIVPRANRALSVEDITAAAHVLEVSRVVLLQLELPPEAVLEAARIVRRAGGTVVLNPAPAVPSLGALAGLVDHLVCNQTEASLLSGIPCRDDRMNEVIARLRQASGAAGVVVTLGSGGVIVASGEQSAHRRAHSVDCVDSVGAGDAFCGVMAALLSAGAGLEEAVRYGNAAGALAVTRAGAEPSMPARSEVDALVLGAEAPA